MPLITCVTSHHTFFASIPSFYFTPFCITPLSLNFPLTSSVFTAVPLSQVIAFIPDTVKHPTYLINAYLPMLWPPFSLCPSLLNPHLPLYTFSPPSCSHLSDHFYLCLGSFTPLPRDHVDPRCGHTLPRESPETESVHRSSITLHALLSPSPSPRFIHAHCGVSSFMFRLRSLTESCAHFPYHSASVHL